ncbi:MAG: hypothetical protein LBV71_16195 [Prevotella sp.]|nr:hypothetical protein [Prevotella sp.]
MVQFKSKQDEINDKLNSLCPDYNDRIRVQEYISRSIISNYYLIPRGTNKEQIVYTPLDNDYYDIGIPSTQTSIEVKERSSIYDGRLIIEEKKFINLMMQRKPYYINYSLDGNTIYTFDLNIQDIQDIPTEILTCNDITYKSSTDKIEKKVKYLPKELAYTYTVNQPFINIKYDYVKRLTIENINKKILKK